MQITNYTCFGITILQFKNNLYTKKDKKNLNCGNTIKYSCFTRDHLSHFQSQQLSNFLLQPSSMILFNFNMNIAQKKVATNFYKEPHVGCYNNLLNVYKYEKDLFIQLHFSYLIKLWIVLSPECAGNRQEPNIKAEFHPKMKTKEVYTYLSP